MVTLLEKVTEETVGAGEAATVTGGVNGTRSSGRSYYSNLLAYHRLIRIKIKIRGGTATEITAAGISINYSIVELTNKGAFSLEGSSKVGRAWFIGAQSFLLLDIDMVPYNCN